MAEDSTVNGAGSGKRGRWRLALPVLLLAAVGAYALYAIRPVGPDDAAPRRADAPAAGEERAARTGDTAPEPAPAAAVDVAGGQPAPTLTPGAGAPGALPPVPQPVAPGALGAAADPPTPAPAIADDPEARRRALAAAGPDAADVGDTAVADAPPPDPATIAAPGAEPPMVAEARGQADVPAPSGAPPTGRAAGELASAPVATVPADPARAGGASDVGEGREVASAGVAEGVAASGAASEEAGRGAGDASQPAPAGASATDADTGGAPAETLATSPDDGAPFDTTMLAPDTTAAAPRTPAVTTPPGRAVVEPDRAPAPVPGDVSAPRFDVVRIDAGGSGLVAGRAEPGARVKVLAGDLVLATVEAGRSGEFVAFVQIPAGDEGQVLQLLAETGRAAARSAEEILVLPPPAASETPAAPEAAPAIVRAEPGSETVRVERPSALGKVDGVTIDAISYDEAGEVKLSGRAPGAQPIRIYLDDAPAGAVRASEAGLWEARVEGVAEGRYTLRVDALNPDGSVESRAETPFQRVYPTAEQRAQPARIIVQPGNTLWVMARERYGRGILYTQIYLANQDAIRDPDLIYPGQIFDIPEEDEFVR